MPSRVNIPKVSLRKRENKKKGTWSYLIYFCVDYKVYEATIAIPNCPYDIAEGIQSQTSTALAGRGNFPKEIADAPAIKKYIADLNPSSEAPPIPLIIERYRKNILSTTRSATYQKESMKHVEEFLVRTNGLDGITPATVSDYLNDILIDADGKPTKKPTRNSTYGHITRFFNWIKMREC